MARAKPQPPVITPPVVERPPEVDTIVTAKPPPAPPVAKVKPTEVPPPPGMVRVNLRCVVIVNDQRYGPGDGVLVPEELFHIYKNALK